MQQKWEKKVILTLLINELLSHDATVRLKQESSADNNQEGRDSRRSPLGGGRIDTSD